MKTLNLNQSIRWIKTSDSPLAKQIFKSIKAIKSFELPAPKVLTYPMRLIYKLLTISSEFISRILWCTPIFKARLNHCGKKLNLYGGIPFISGPLTIEVGDNCRISGQTTFSGRSLSDSPTLLIGNNVDVGWMTTIAVGQKVLLGDNVRIAGRAFLAGYPGHPINAEDRAKGLPDLEDQIGDIILEDDVWLATGVSVMAGVIIGKGTIVAAGSVVTKDLPAGVLAAGVPAKVVRQL